MLANYAAKPSLTEFHSLCRESLALYLKVERKQYYPADESQRKHVHESLKSFWNVLASLIATDTRWNGTALANPDRPGFVSVSVGDKFIDAPFFIVNDLPPKKLLSQMYRLGLDLRVAGTSTICLSGSVCYAGTSKYFGDVDFCEYIPANDATIAEGLLSATRGSSLDLCLYKLCLGGQEWQRSNLLEWSNLQNKLQDEPAVAINSIGFRQCVHVASLPTSGVVEATNVLLFVNVAPGIIGERNLTFAFQEVPLATDWIPTDISDPIQFGRYIAWLHRQVSELLANRKASPLGTIKGARRALALARITMLGEEARKLVVHLRNKKGGKIAALAARCKLHAVISSYESVAPFGQYLSGLRKTIDDMRGMRVLRADFYNKLLEDEEALLSSYVTAVGDSLDGLALEVERRLGSVPPASTAPK